MKKGHFGALRWAVKLPKPLDVLSPVRLMCWFVSLSVPESHNYVMPGGEVVDPGLVFIYLVQKNIRVCALTRIP